MGDFVKFKKMITPIAVQVIFWIGVAVCIAAGTAIIIATESASSEPYGYSGGTPYFRSRGMIYVGFLIVFIGPILIRIFCELVIIIFSINDTLTHIKNSLLKEKL